MRGQRIGEYTDNCCEKGSNAGWFAISRRRWQGRGAKCNAGEVMGSDDLPFDCDVVEVLVDK